MAWRAVITGAFALALSFGTAQASPVDVSFTLTGSAGNWTYDFTVTNNLPAPFNIFMFGAGFATHELAGSPTDWNDYATGNGTLPFNYAGLSAPYYDVWRSTQPFIGSIAPGQSLGGFQVVDTSPTKFGSVHWFAFAAALNAPDSINPTIDYTGPGCSMNCSYPNRFNPGFQGVAVSSTPLPAALPFFATAIGALGLLGWRRAHKPA